MLSIKKKLKKEREGGKMVRQEKGRAKKNEKGS